MRRARDASASRARIGCVAVAARPDVHPGGGARDDGSQRIVLICGRYEGVDERVSEHLADREISVGDFVLSGGELAAAIIIDTMTRLVPGALGNAASSQQESFTASAVDAQAERPR